SGVLVSTGAGSTGWLSSVFNMASGVMGMNAGGRVPAKRPQLRWEDQRLVFVVREPFISKTSAAQMVAGFVDGNDLLLLESMMPANGVIFSDGVEQDFVEFNAGVTARIQAAEQRARLVMK
ncbi:MAG: NAD+ kinase, partial [Candidatus Sumerlaeota bacterium]